jgi:hypothetical protein
MDEVAPQAEIEELIYLRQQIDNRLNDLRTGGVPMGAKPGMGSQVGPDRPPMPKPIGLLV